jgi:hypothetical protein
MIEPKIKNNIKYHFGGKKIISYGLKYNLINMVIMWTTCIKPMKMWREKNVYLPIVKSVYGEGNMK